MYKVINIAGKDYKMEYTLEASLFSECTESLVNFMTKIALAQSAENIDPALPDDKKEKYYRDSMKEGISGVSNIPSVAMNLWYAGFLEYHGSEGLEDNSVKTFADAKNLYRQYAKENPKESSFYDIIGICLEQMETDGFFQRIGLDKMFEMSNPVPMTPQDHKRKKKVSEK